MAITLLHDLDTIRGEREEVLMSLEEAPSGIYDVSHVIPIQRVTHIVRSESAMVWTI